MNKFSDEREIQKAIEHGHLEMGEDAEAYRKVFDILKKEPGFQLPSSFADSVMKRIEMPAKPSYEWAWIAAGIFFLIGSAIITFLWVGATITLPNVSFTLDLTAYPFLTNHLWLFLFGAGFIGLLHWIDKLFISPSKNILN